MSVPQGVSIHELAIRSAVRKIADAKNKLMIEAITQFIGIDNYQGSPAHLKRTYADKFEAHQIAYFKDSRDGSDGIVADGKIIILFKALEILRSQTKAEAKFAYRMMDDDDFLEMRFEGETI